MINYAICAIIPTYNNASTLCDVVLRTAKHIPDIIVVIDGSTDNSRELLQDLPLPLTIIDYSQNKGKGFALKRGMKEAIALGYTHALTIDSDGQHFPEDIPHLLNVSIQNPQNYIVGERIKRKADQPKKNSYANSFSNFWFRVQTLVNLHDTQSGMRIYPLERLHGLNLLTNRFEAELAILVFALWANETVSSVPVRVYYPPKEQRVSHFHPFKDFMRITMLNTILTLSALVFGLPYKFIHRLGVHQLSKKFILLLLVFFLPFHVCAVRSIKGGERVTPRLSFFRAPQHINSGIAVIVCPGGSYSWLDIQTEGVEVASWLQSIGINAFVLQYRVATVSAYILGYRVLGIGHTYPDMLVDVQNALMHIHIHSQEYQIDTSKIGIIGFSAGGHLALSSFVYNDTPYKPKFVSMIYPVVSMSQKIAHKRSRRGALGVWGQYNTKMRDSLSLELHIPNSCPPVFLTNCKDDPIVDYRNSELLDAALYAKNIPHLYIQYQTGGHGFGINENKTTKEAIQWKKAFITWLNTLYHV